jgi:MHS family proline/betaine transporter-like MFS transporter
MTSAEQAQSVPAPDESKTRKAIAAGAIGNATEWFDFGVYGFLVGTVGAQFFPNSDPATQTLSAFAAFAASFVIRPLGSLFFGPLGDRIGRKRVLAITIILMAGSTAFIGILPTHAQVGIWAPVLLVLARMIQGFSTGGEYAGAATFISEYAPDKRRGFWGSWLEFGTLAGFSAGALLVTALTLILPDATMSSWGWRIPFLVALPLGLIGLYLRTRLKDTPVFEETQAEHRAVSSPLRELFANHWREMMICLGLVVLLNIADYLMLVYLQDYLTQVLHISTDSALVMICGVLVAMMVVIVPLGSLSDRIGRKPLLLTSGLGFLVFSYPAFWLLSQGSIPTTLAGLAIIGFFLVCYLAVVGSTLPAIFDTRIRYAGFAISYNISTSLFGGTAPLVIGLLVDRTGNNYMPAFYLMAAAAVSIIPMLLLKETAGQPLRGTVAAERLAASPGPVPGTAPA